MILTNNQIVNSIESINELLNKEINVKTSFTLMKNIKKIDEVNNIYLQSKNKLIKKHAFINDNDFKTDLQGNIIFKDKEGWIKDMTELLSLKNEIDIHQISIDDLGDVKVSPKILMNLSYMFK